MEQSQVTHNMRKKRQSGQTIIEIIVATGIVALVMTSIVALVSVSIKDASESKSKAIATKYDQEAMEFFREQRSLLGWESFLAVFPQNGSKVTYCLATLPATTLAFTQMSAGACNNAYVDPMKIFTRQTDVQVNTVNGQKVVDVTVYVTWMDGLHLRNFSIAQQFFQWSAN